MKENNRKKPYPSIKEMLSPSNRLANVKLSSFPNKKTKMVERLRIGKDKSNMYKNIIYIEPLSFEIYTLGDVSFKMIYCPPNIRPKKPRENVQHEHKIVNRGFYIGETQVTQDIWKKIYPRWNPSLYRGSNQPVEQITWLDCLDFCNKLSELNHYKPCYVLGNISRNPYENNNITKMDFEILENRNGFRLPLLEEWIYAAKAGTHNKYVSTNDHALALQRSTSQDYKEVKSNPPNEWGIYDFKKLVYEWCEDEQQSYYPSQINNNDQVSKWNIKHNIAGFGSKDNRHENIPIQTNIENYVTSYSEKLGMRLARTP